jgi:hypothetical protein
VIAVVVVVVVNIIVAAMLGTVCLLSGNDQLAQQCSQQVQRPEGS